MFSHLVSGGNHRDIYTNCPQVTTAKKANLILNVDGCIAVCFVDMLRSSKIIGSSSSKVIMILLRQRPRRRSRKKTKTNVHLVVHVPVWEGFETFSLIQSWTFASKMALVVVRYENEPRSLKRSNKRRKLWFPIKFVVFENILMKFHQKCHQKCHQKIHEISRHFVSSCTF